MKSLFLKFIISFLIMDFSHAKPVMNNDSDLKSSRIESKGLSFHQKSQIESSIKKMHGLFKRAADPITFGSKSSSKTGFAAITTSESQNERKKTRKCLKWTKEPMTNRNICVKFNKSKLPEISTKLPVISTKLPASSTKLPEISNWPQKDEKMVDMDQGTNH